VSGWGTLYHREKAEDDGLERADELVIRFGWARYYVPKVCPHCRQVTTEDDWSGPHARDRLRAVKVEGSRFFGWEEPPTSVFEARVVRGSAPTSHDHGAAATANWHAGRQVLAHPGFFDLEPEATAGPDDVARVGVDHVVGRQVAPANVSQHEPMIARGAVSWHV
jgi:hypothetical protein